MVFLTFFVNQRDNQDVSFETFFTFIVHNNVVVIQWVIVGVIAMALLYLGLRIFAKEKLSSDDVVFVERSGGRSHTSTSASEGSAHASSMAPSVDEIMSQPGMEDSAEGGAAPAAVGLGSGPAAATSDKTGAAGGAAAAVNAAEVVELQKQLKARELEIATLKTDIEKGKGADIDTSEMQAKLAELEAKLAEYEILEDDIADLSHFKEENARLKDEIEALKAGGASAPAEAPQAEEPVASEPEPEVEEPVAEEVEAAPAEVESESVDSEKEDLMAEFEASLGPEDLEEAPTKAAPDADDGADFVAEFEAAVQQQKSPEEEAIAATPEPSDSGVDEVTVIDAETPPKEESSDNDSSGSPQDAIDQMFAAAESAVTTSAPEETKAPAPEPAPKKAVAEPEEDEAAPDMPTGDDILAEFSQSLGPDDTDEGAGEVEETKDAGSGGLDASLDTDKVLAEMADLATAATEGDSSSALEDEMDTEKMAEEASRLLNGE